MLFIQIAKDTYFQIDSTRPYQRLEEVLKDGHDVVGIWEDIHSMRKQEKLQESLRAAASELKLLPPSFSNPPVNREDLEAYRHSAEAGDAIAQYKLGKLCLQGGTFNNFPSTYSWYQNSIALGNAKAEWRHAELCNRLALLSVQVKLKGQSINNTIKRITKKPIKLLRNDHIFIDYARLHTNLLKIRFTNSGSKNQGYAVRYIKAKSELNAFRKSLQEKTSGTAEPHESPIRALDWYTKSAEADLGIYWLAKSAEAGTIFAQLSLGLAYYNGSGVEKNQDQALHWIRRAAEQNDAEAQNILGWLYAKIEQDSWRSIEWFLKAAEKNHLPAQFNLGTVLLIGSAIGAFDRAEEGRTWLETAANNGHLKAQIVLGESYQIAESFPLDFKQSFKWFSMAAEAGDTKAQRELYKLYFNGRGVAENPTKAYSWFLISLRNGSPPIHSEEEFKAKLDPQQIEVAQEFARQWRTSSKRKEKVSR